MLQFHRQWISSPYTHFNISFSVTRGKCTSILFSPLCCPVLIFLSGHYCQPYSSPTAAIASQLICSPSDARAGCTHWRFCVHLEVHVTVCVKHHLMCTTWSLPGFLQLLAILCPVCSRLRSETCLGFCRKHILKLKETHTVTWLAWKLLWEPLPVSSVIQSSLQEF